jgi:methionyl-tRNA synthetase
VAKRFKGYEMHIEMDVTNCQKCRMIYQWLEALINYLNTVNAYCFKHETLNEDGMDVVWLNSGKRELI